MLGQDLGTEPSFMSYGSSGKKMKSEFPTLNSQGYTHKKKKDLLSLYTKPTRPMNQSSAFLTGVRIPTEQYSLYVYAAIVSTIFFSNM